MTRQRAPDEVRRRAVAAMTFATGVIIANNYYMQPLEATMAAEFAVPSSAIGAVLTVIQLSYALGLAILVPLGDLLERRRLVLVMLAVTVLGLAATAAAPNLPVLVIAAGVVGLTTVAAQVLVPFAAEIAPEGKQGGVVSTVMSGLLIGILASRVVAGVVAQLLGWPAVFIVGAVLTTVAGIALWRTLPVLPPSLRMSYPRLLGSVTMLIRREPVLRVRMAYGASVYAAFGSVWTSVGFLLAGPPFRLSDAEIGLFALFGVAGALAARVAGRLADRGHAHVGTGVFLAATALGFAALAPGVHSLVLLAIGLVLFDLGVQGTHISNQSVIYRLSRQARSRLNTAYMTSYFIGGAVGSGLSAVLYAIHGWAAVCWLGAAFPAAGLLLWTAESVAGRRRRRPHSDPTLRTENSPHREKEPDVSHYELIAAGWTTAGAAKTMTADDRSPVDIRTRVEVAGRAGFRGFGLAHLDLLEVEHGIGFPAFRSLLDDNGIEYFEIEFLMDWFASGERRAESDKIRHGMLRAAEAVGARHIKAGDHRGAKLSTDELAEHFAGLATDAANVGSRIALEPMPFGSISTPTQGLEIVRKSGHPAGGLLIDIWHMSRGGIDFESLRDLPSEYIAAVELDDAPLEFTGDMLTDTFDGRTLCGDGEFDIPAFIDAIKATGYRGPWGVEILGAQYRTLPVEQAVPAAFDTTMRYLEASDR